MKRTDRAPVRDTAIPTHPSVAAKKLNLRAETEAVSR